MPKAFNDREKELIKARLMEKAAEFLAVYGVRKTSVEDLTKAVGISKGAFYVFFDSKEELFLEIFEKYEREIRDEIMRIAFRPDMSPKESFRLFIKELFNLMYSNPILKHINSGEFEYLLRKLPEEKIQNHIRNDDDFICHFIEQKKMEGVLKDYDAKTISGLFRALFFIGIHKDEIGEESYPALVDMLSAMIADYLVNE